MEASGQINQRGVVALAFQRMGQVATVTGRVAKGYGSGTWSSSPCNAVGRGGRCGKGDELAARRGFHGNDGVVR